MIDATAHTSHAEPAEGAFPSRARVGMYCLIATEAALFTIFVVAYLFYIGKSLIGPYPAQVLDVPVLPTICLLASSATIMLAEGALRQGYGVRFSGWLLLTILLGVGVSTRYRRRMAPPDLHPASDDQHEPLRDHVLRAGRVPRHACDSGTALAHAGADFESLWLRYRGPEGSCRSLVAVLAFRRRRLGGRLSRGLHYRSLIRPGEATYGI